MRATKSILLFDGIPGAGKTTHLERLRRALGADYLSMARFAEARGVGREERWRHAEQHGRPHPADVAFLDALDETVEPFVLVEKFGRTAAEATALVERAALRGWRVELVHLVFSGDEARVVDASVQRQLARGMHHGRVVHAEEARRRAVLHLRSGSGGRERFAALGVPVHRIDAGSPVEVNHARVRAALGFEVGSLPWDEEPLRELAIVAGEFGIEAWASAGHLYRPFWNGRFGPAQWPSDVDVAVHAQDEVLPLLSELERRFPLRRWSVMCPAERLQRKLGLRTGSLFEAKAYAKLMHKAGAVRWSLDRSEVEARFTGGAEGALWAGVVRLNERLMEAVADGSSEARAYARDEAGVVRAVRDYPGLRVHPATVDRLEGFAAAWHPVMQTGSSWRALKEEVVRDAAGVADRRRARRRMTPEERALADEIVALHAAGAGVEGVETRARPSLPRVDRTVWPEPLEDLRRARERRKAGVDDASDRKRVVAPPPEGWSSWLHHLGACADDALFRDWFLHQSRHHAPVGGKDPVVRGVLDGSWFDCVLSVRTANVAQTPMHEGWTLPQHLAASVLALETDRLISRFREEGHPEDWLRGLRLSMRVAMLFHDVGKRVAPAASWRHGRIGARLWQRTRPAWFPPEWAPHVGWMVEHHDLFGAFARGLTEGVGAAFPGAVDAQALRAGLRQSGWPLRLGVAVNSTVWRADVGSVAALRWLLPMADLVERLVLTGDGGVDVGPRQRRRRPCAGAADPRAVS